MIEATGKATSNHDQFREELIFFQMSMYVQQDRGYKGRWANINFKNKYGRWPSKDIIETAQPILPSDDFLEWLRDKQAAWAKTQDTNNAPAKTNNYYQSEVERINAEAKRINAEARKRQKQVKKQQVKVPS